MKSSQVRTSKTIYSKFAKVMGTPLRALEDEGLCCVLNGGHWRGDAESRRTVEAGHGVCIFGFLWSVLH